MKKILASVVAVAAVTGFASVAHAGGDNTGTGGSSTAANFTSDHSGSVAATCSLKVDDGALNTTAAGLVGSITSVTKGKISTVCNSSGSKLDVTLDTGAGSGHTIAAGLPVAAGYEQKFQLDGGTGAYNALATVGFVAAATNFKTDLTNGYSSTASALDVTAKVAVANGYILPAGAYTVKVKATVTP